MTVHVDISEVTVSVLPRDHIDRDIYEITVAWRGRDRWAVCRMRQCLGSDGEWDYESIPSERSEEWLATHRFSYEEALSLAVKAAPDVTCNGRVARNHPDAGEAPDAA